MGLHVPSALVLRDGMIDDGLRRGLTAAGYGEIREESSCGQMRAALSDCTEGAPLPDLVVIDVSSDRDQRLALCRTVSHQLANVPLLVVDDETGASFIDDVFAAGATDLLLRPFDRTDVAIRARCALRLALERARSATRERRLVAETLRLEGKAEDLSRLVSVDPLTGLINRRFASSLIEAEWRRAARIGSPVAAIMVDLDCFHAFNERYGHEGGDACLREVARTMADSLRRPTDFLARYGGEEFLAFLASTDAAGAEVVARRVCDAVAALSIPHEGGPFDVVTVSVGFASDLPAEGSSVRSLLAKADSALFEAKAQGRNRVRGDVQARLPSPPLRAWPPETTYPIVVVDPSLVDRVPDLLSETEAQTRVLVEALYVSNFDRIQLLGARLNIAARDIGLEDLANLAARVDSGAQRSDVSAIEGAIAELSTYLARVQVVYRRVEDRSRELVVPSERLSAARSRRSSSRQ